MLGRGCTGDFEQVDDADLAPSCPRRRCPDLWRQRGSAAAARAQGWVVLGALMPNSERPRALGASSVGSGFAEPPQFRARSLNHPKAL